jgi:hypothetical protein
MTPNNRGRGGYHPIDGPIRLHEMGPLLRLRYMERHAIELIRLLDVKLEMTYAAAPFRNQSSELTRANKRLPHHREAKLERAIARQWKYNATCHDFLPGVCRGIVSYQVPLFATARKSGWGYVDLLGISRLGLPVVIELKDEDSNDTPLRMLVEALAYGLAIRNAWNERPHRLAGEWRAALGSGSGDDGGPLTEVPLVCLAPEKYWRRRIGEPDRHSNGKVRHEAWSALSTLMRGLALRGFPATLAQLDTDGEDDLLIGPGSPVSPPNMGP